ncbi:MAG: hypothetical protein J7576_12180 [Siphonobacter aquaeclarae]|nr:hypothetical protein [Siphonobacter aquaeclarae]
MTGTEQLHRLILRMDKAERRRFRQQAADGQYLRLYTRLEELPAWTPASEADLQKEFPQLEPTRKYLQVLILESLRDRTDIVRNMLLDADTWHRKGFLAQSLATWRKAGDLAREAALPILEAEALQGELHVWLESGFGNAAEEELIRKQERLATLLEDRRDVRRQAELFEILSFRYRQAGTVRTDAEIRQLHDLVLQESQMVRQSRRADDRLHRHFQALYLRITGDSAASLGVLLDLAASYRGRTLSGEETDRYYRLLHEVLSELYAWGRYDEMTPFLEDLGKNASSRQVFLLHAFTQAKGLKKPLNTLRQDTVQHYGKGLEGMEDRIRFTFLFESAEAWFAEGALSQALREVNEVLNCRSSRENDQVIRCRMLFWLIQKQRRNEDLLRSELRSAIRRYGKEGVVGWVIRWLSGYDEAILRRELAQLRQIPYEARLIRALRLEDRFTPFPLRG